MSNLRLTDIIVPSVFAAYVSVRTVELSNILQSGLVNIDTSLNAFVDGPGNAISMPRRNDLPDSGSQVLELGKEIELDRMTAGVDLAPKLFRAQGWESSQLLSALAGFNQEQEIIDKVATWWARDKQKIILSILNGVFDSASMEHATIDASDEPISSNIVLAGRQVLGDNSGILSIIMMHSSTRTELSRQNLIETIPNARGEIAFELYLGFRVVVNDNLPYEDGVYTTYLASNGALQMGRGVPAGIEPVQIEEIPKLSTSALYMRETTIINPKGISYVKPGFENGSPLPSPSNIDLATGANWNRSNDIEKKSIGLVRIKHADPSKEPENGRKFYAPPTPATAPKINSRATGPTVK